MPKRLPRVTIALPCHNKANCLGKTISSIVKLNYPQNLVQVIVVDDASGDGTHAEALRLQKAYPELDMLVLKHGTNRGKAAAMNTALAKSTGEFFACLDADTTLHPDAIRNLVPHFSRRNVGAVIGQVKVENPRTLYERIQRVEYIYSNFIRRLWSNLRTLFVAPGGACSLFRAQTVRELGGFAEAGMTEDLEIGLRLKANGYDVHMEPKAITYTTVPKTWRALWRQRVRWYRGFAVNHLKYRGLFFRKSHGLFSSFQLPINVLGIILLLTTVFIVSYGSLSDLYELLYRSLTIKGYFFNHVLNFPTPKELLLGQNVQVLLPIVTGTLLLAYLVYVAHQEMQERLFRSLHYAWIYFFIVPYVTTVHWLSAIVHEALRTRRKW
jgi:cellulose synthase/poly-beta-1,6-N-acetylglucosamine synthase-like glycosyltransferase